VDLPLSLTGLLLQLLFAGAREELTGGGTDSSISADLDIFLNLIAGLIAVGCRASVIPPVSRL